jgi:3,4-dihydroxy 2-butanone 4-phosphate synthase/GTP cyclohydrolase II
MTTDSATVAFEAAMAAYARGELVLIFDERQPEAGAYVSASARRVDARKINFMVTHARGLICLALTEERMQRLGIPMMVSDTPFSRRLAFGASIEAARGVSTGISAADRAATILAASAPDARAGDIVMPGHVFPLLVRRGGVLFKPAVAEAAVDLAVLAGDGDAAALCAVLDEDGGVATAQHARELARRFELPFVAVGDVVAHRLRSELIVERVAERPIESALGGVFRAIVYRNQLDRDEHMALVAGEPGATAPTLVRVHSQCLTGDVLGSTRCDCGDQLALAMEVISREGCGAIVYMHQEGRGIGLGNKIRAYALQDRGRDTVEANLELGFKDDLRDYAITAQILKDLGITSVRLLTNNPQKVEGLRRYGVRVVERVPIEAPAHAGNIEYLRTKRRKLGHLLDETRLGGGRGSSQ